MLTQQDLDQSFDEGLKWAKANSFRNGRLLANRGAQNDSKIRMIHSKATYSDSDCLTGARMAGENAGMADNLQIAEARLAAEYEYALISYKSSTKTGDEDRNILSRKMHKLGEKWEQLYRRNRENRLQSTAGICFEHAAIALLEKKRISSDDLTNAFTYLERASNIKSKLHDRYGMGFNYLNCAIYWRKSFRNKKDLRALEVALKEVEKAVRLFKEFKHSPDAHEQLGVLPATLNALKEILEDWKSKSEESVAEQFLPAEFRNDLLPEVKDLSAVHLLDSIRANPGPFGWPEPPTWLDERQYSQSVTKELPALSRIEKIIDDSILIAEVKGINRSQAEALYAIDLSTIRSFYGTPIDHENVIDRTITTMANWAASERPDLAMKAWIQVFKQLKELRQADNYVEFISHAAKNWITASSIDGFLGALRENNISERGLDFLAIDLVRHGFEKHSTILVRSVYKDWVASGTVNHPTIVALHDPRDACLFLISPFGYRTRIIEGVGGYSLTSMMYSFSRRRPGGYVNELLASTAFDEPFRTADSILEVFSEVGSQLIDLCQEEDVNLIFIGASGYFRYLPLESIPVDGQPLWTKLSVINLCRSNRPLSERYSNINISNPKLFSAARALPDSPLLDAESECASIARCLDCRNCHTGDATSADLIAGFHDSTVFHFSGHGGISTVGSVPHLVANDGVLRIEDVVDRRKPAPGLVTLSCCSSGSHTTTFQPGLEGLLSMGGCNWIVVSRWPVLSSVASKFMVDFYENLASRSKRRELNADDTVFAFYDSLSKLDSWCLSYRLDRIHATSFSLFV